MILLFAPILIELYLLVPEVRELSTTIVIMLIAFSLCNVFIIYSRISGVKAMKKCFPIIMPAQEFLLPSNTYIDSITKQRYYDFLTRNLPGFTVLKTDAEMKPLVSTAVTWLITQTRSENDFPLIYEENINFGISYNLLGLKTYGITFSLLILLINCSIIILNWKFKLILNLSYPTVVASSFIDILFLLLWIFIVTKNLVKNCGKKYGRALLSACDSPKLNNITLT